jgi:hypothetical protein
MSRLYSGENFLLPVVVALRALRYGVLNYFDEALSQIGELSNRLMETSTIY